MLDVHGVDGVILTILVVSFWEDFWPLVKVRLLEATSPEGVEMMSLKEGDCPRLWPKQPPPSHIFFEVCEPLGQRSAEALHPKIPTLHMKNFDITTKISGNSLKHYSHSQHHAITKTVNFNKTELLSHQLEALIVSLILEKTLQKNYAPCVMANAAQKHKCYT